MISINGGERDWRRFLETDLDFSGIRRIPSSNFVCENIVDDPRRQGAGPEIPPSRLAEPSRYPPAALGGAGARILQFRFGAGARSGPAASPVGALRFGGVGEFSIECDA